MHCVENAGRTLGHVEENLPVGACRYECSHHSLCEIDRAVCALLIVLRVNCSRDERGELTRNTVGG